MTEKCDLTERIMELVKLDVLKQEDRDAIYWVCLAACVRELVLMGKEK